MNKKELLTNIEMVCYAIKQKRYDKYKVIEIVYDFNMLNEVYLTKTFVTDNDSNQYSGKLIIDTIHLTSLHCDLTFDACKAEKSVVYSHIPLEIFSDEILEEIYLKLREYFVEL